MCESFEEEYGTPKAPYKRSKKPIVKADAKYRDMVKQIESILHPFRLEIDGLLRELEEKESTIQEQADTIVVQREAIRFDAETIETQAETIKTVRKTWEIQDETIKIQADTINNQLEMIESCKRRRDELLNKFHNWPLWKIVWKRFTYHHGPMIMKLFNFYKEKILRIR